MKSCLIEESQRTTVFGIRFWQYLQHCIMLCGKEYPVLYSIIEIYWQVTDTMQAQLFSDLRIKFVFRDNNIKS